MNILKKLGVIIDKTENGLLFILCTSIIAFVFLNVIIRNFSDLLGVSFPWTEELVRFFFVFLGFLGAAAAFRTGRHGGIPLLVEIFSPRIQKLIHYFVVMIMILIFITFAYQSYVTALVLYKSGQISSSLKLPMWTIYAAMTGCFVLSVWRVIQWGLLETPPSVEDDLKKIQVQDANDKEDV